MAEIEKTPDLITSDDIGANVIDHTIVADSFINVSSSDPTKDNDTGQGYVLGSLWVNSTSGDVFQAIIVSAEDARWANQEGDDINPPFVFQASSKVGRTGGYEDGPGASPTAQHAHIQMMEIASEGNSTDIGEVSPSLGIKGWQAGCAKDGHPASYIYHYSGVGTTPSSSPTAEMVRHGVSSPATLADVGENTHVHGHGGNACNGSYWFTWGGGGGTTSADAPYSTQIEKTTFAVSAVTADSGGDLTTPISHLGAHTDLVNSRAYISGGVQGGPSYTEVDQLSYFPLGISSGTNTDYGEASFATHNMGSTNSTTHAYHFGSHSPFTDLIEKYPMTAPTSNTDVGNLLAGQFAAAGASAPTASYIMGGNQYPPSTGLDTISKFLTTSDGDATDVGEMTEQGYGPACWQD